MAYSEILTLSSIGLFVGSLVGLLSIGGGLILVPLLHVLYPSIEMQDIVIISLHQILLSSFVTFMTHSGKQPSLFKDYKWLSIHFICLIVAGFLLHFIKAIWISILFIIFVSLSILVRICIHFKITVNQLKHHKLVITTLCASYGSIIGLGGSLLLYPLLRLSNETYTKALKQCALSSFTVGLLGVITQDLIYLLNINHYFPWKIMLIIAITSSVFARLMSLYTYKLDQSIIDNLSFVVSIVVLISYCCYL